eukprot:1633583-Alexandrium_andersonii.AAC.1
MQKALALAALLDAMLSLPTSLPRTPSTRSSRRACDRTRSMAMRRASENASALLVHSLRAKQPLE